MYEFVGVDPICKAGNWLFSSHEPMVPPAHVWELEYYEPWDDFGWGKAVLARPEFTGFIQCMQCGIKKKAPERIVLYDKPLPEEWE